MQGWPRTTHEWCTLNITHDDHTVQLEQMLHLKLVVVGVDYNKTRYISTGEVKPERPFGIEK